VHWRWWRRFLHEQIVQLPTTWEQSWLLPLPLKGAPAAEWNSIPRSMKSREPNAMTVKRMSSASTYRIG
jgi:hypothetical protein